MNPKHRLVALDHLRGFVIGLVVLHHAALAYCGFGHIDRRHYLLSTAPIVDPQRWVGFDILVLLNDGFFMPLMFLLSGLFVWGGLSRKGARGYLSGRVLRLGVPFAAAVLVLVPIAYYPSWLQAGGAPGFLNFWRTMVTVGPWPSGPPWFIGVLLVFDAVSALAYVVAGRPVPRSIARAGWTPLGCFGGLLACLLLAYLPLLAVFGPAPWLAVGPLAIQASRLGLYAMCFAAGVALGPDPLVLGGVGFRERLALHWPGWSALTAVAGALFVATLLAQRQGWAMARPDLSLMLHGAAFVVFCAAACFTAFAVALRFATGRSALWDGLAANSYAIYLLHYPVVTWLQYGLLRAPLNAIVKAAAVFIAALLLSWAGAAGLRRTPGVAALV